MKKATSCIHTGTYHDPITGGVNSPIFTSSSFEYLERDNVSYPRYFNTPNQDAVVQKMRALEGAEDGILFSSGMAAISTILLSFLKTGDHVVLLDDLYGGTHAFATDMFNGLDISFSFVTSTVEGISQAITEKTKVIVIESPTNPLLNVVDIQQIAALAKEHGIITIIDNTFATPINQTPIQLGIDVVVHSGTKYLGGHSDLCCGAALTSKAYAAQIRTKACHLGGSLNATTVYLLERSLKTLALRVERQSENASRLAQFLSSHSAVAKVNYPGLPSFPGHAIAKKQMKQFGGMLSFELNRDLEQTTAFLSKLQIVRSAVSLGGVETLICSPAQTSHVKMSAEERQRVGINDGLLRLSVGIEAIEDLIADFSQAFE